MGKYYVAWNYCDCHPETCCCNDWAVFDENKEKVATAHDKKSAQEKADVLNAKDYKLIYDKFSSYTIGVLNKKTLIAQLMEYKDGWHLQEIYQKLNSDQLMEISFKLKELNT